MATVPPTPDFHTSLTTSAARFAQSAVEHLLAGEFDFFALHAATRGALGEGMACDAASQPHHGGEGLLLAPARLRPWYPRKEGP